MKRKNVLRAAALTLAVGMMMSMPVSAANHKWKKLGSSKPVKVSCNQHAGFAKHSVTNVYYECSKCGASATQTKVSDPHLNEYVKDERKTSGSCTGK